MALALLWELEDPQQDRNLPRISRIHGAPSLSVPSSKFQMVQHKLGAGE